LTEAKLAASASQISDLGLSYLADMPALCVADVRGCFRVTAVGASALRNRTGMLGPSFLMLIQTPLARGVDGAFSIRLGYTISAVVLMPADTLQGGVCGCYWATAMPQQQRRRQLLMPWRQLLWRHPSKAMVTVG
jgi:hypothetical protein